jgi:Uncharacterised protein family (UPF0158)
LSAAEPPTAGSKLKAGGVSREGGVTMSANVHIDGPELKPLAVDLDMLSEFLEGDPSGDAGRLSLRTGEIWSIQYGEDPVDEAEDEWIRIDQHGSSEAHRDMVDFSAAISYPELSRLLDVALGGRGAFRRFKDVLVEYPDERERWFAFSDQRRLGRALEWLAELGYRCEAAADA